MKIGYILARELSDDLFMGGLLVTDQKGFPIEFRYTDPIKPSKLQQIIYGNALDRYLIVEVIARSLAESITDKPEIYITDSKLILELKDILAAPLVSIQESGESPLPELGDITKLENGGILMQIHPTGSPAHITFTGSEADFEKMHPLIKGAGSEMDLLEPLKRINEALKEILKSAEKRGL
jgi:hypothetical protein